MSYYVNIGGITLYGVTEVEETSGREMQEYDGIGSGKFPVPENRDMHTWVISCHLTEKDDYHLPHWQPASEIFRLFEVLLDTKDPSNFILTSKGDYTAASGYLESYVKDEKFPGVFEVSVKVRENRVVGVKTTDVPYIARPGKKPVPPKVTVKKGGNAYETTVNTTGKEPDIKIDSSYKLGVKSDNHGEIEFKDPKTGKPISNPALVGEGDTLSLTEAITNPKDLQTWAKQNPIDIKDLGTPSTIGKKAVEVAKRKAEQQGTKNIFDFIGDKIREWSVNVVLNNKG